MAGVIIGRVRPADLGLGNDPVAPEAAEAGLAAAAPEAPAVADAAAAEAPEILPEATAVLAAPLAALAEV